MTDCRWYQERLETFHDGELSGPARWRVGRHVEACARCRALLEELRAIGGLVRDDERAAPPAPDLWHAIAARLSELDEDVERRAASAHPEGRMRPRRRWKGLLGPVPIGVGGLAAAAVAVVFWLRAPALPIMDDVVEELDAMGRAVAVIPSDEKSTIIWVLDPQPVESAKESAGEVL